MTELEYLRLRVNGIPVHEHRAVKRGSWYCRSPYCESVVDEECGRAPGQTQAEADAKFDLGELSA